MEPQPTEMPPEFETTSGEANAAKQPRRVWTAWLAWFVILYTVISLMALHLLREGDEAPGLPMAPFEIHAKVLVGFTTFGIGSKQDFAKDIKQAFETGPVPQKLIGSIVIGELSGPEAGLKSLEELENDVQKGRDQASATDKQIIALLKKIQQARIEKKDPLVEFSGDEFEQDRKRMQARYGWASKLAMHPPDSSDHKTRSRLIAEARRAAFIAIGVIGLGMTAAFCGVILQVLFWGFTLSGRLTSGIGPIHASHAIYAETFAVWILLFILLSRIFSLPVFDGLGIGAALIPQIGGLAALAWPVIRGVRWTDVRQDLGLTLGRQRWSVPFVGVGTYLSALPVVLIALIVTVAMMSVATRLGIANDQSAPVHPIIEPMLRGSWWLRLQIVFIAVFAAVPEEIMFRGVLYRHLREASAERGYIASVLIAALVSSLVFAAIHPQGVFGIPVLMSLAIVFALAREWRGSLVPSMIAHAMVNAGTSTVLLLLAD
jgi:membrane protease YdiL (CAAX protease family)